jgi:hypothetical protein
VIKRLIFQNNFHGHPAVGFLFCHDDRRVELNPPPEGGSKKRAGAAITHDLTSPTPATRPVLIGQGKPNPLRRSGKRFWKNNFHLQYWVRIFFHTSLHPVRIARTINDAEETQEAEAEIRMAVAMRWFLHFPRASGRGRPVRFAIHCGCLDQQGRAAAKLSHFGDSNQRRVSLAGNAQWPGAF